jgi:hypothetical protein
MSARRTPFVAAPQVSRAPSFAGSVRIVASSVARPGGRGSRASAVRVYGASRRSNEAYARNPLRPRASWPSRCPAAVRRRGDDGRHHLNRAERRLELPRERVGLGLRLHDAALPDDRRIFQARARAWSYRSRAARLSGLERGAVGALDSRGACRTRRRRSRARARRSRPP